MRKGRYRKNLLGNSDCTIFRQQFHPQILQLQTEKLLPVDFVSRYILEGLQILRPSSWKGARLKAGEPQSALETFNYFSLRGIPLSVNRTLLAWNEGRYQLKLFFHVPSTEEVLYLQSQGIRCVTCITDWEGLGSYVLSERDPLSFTLHDLIHADHFLHDPHQKAVQIGFSRWMLQLWNSKELKSILQKNLQFLAAFEYACADMNSHGAHLVKYLKAIFCQAQIEDLLLDLSEKSSCSQEFQEALANLNTVREKTPHLEILQNELFLKGTAACQNQEHNSIRAREIPTH